MSVLRTTSLRPVLESFLLPLQLDIIKDQGSDPNEQEQEAHNKSNDLDDTGAAFPRTDKSFIDSIRYAVGGHADDNPNCSKYKEAHGGSV